MKYDKLVRDRIPEVIAATGQSVRSHVADEQEYRQKLVEKLREEVNELVVEASAGDIGNMAAELADILEVAEAIETAYGIDPVLVEKVRQEKAIKKGKFVQRIVLDEVVEK